MICQRCYKKEAKVQITQVVNEQKQELHLCEDCAAEVGFNKALAKLPQLFGGLMLDLLKKEVPALDREEGTWKKCHFCGLSWRDFKRTGLFGCDKCYEVFREEVSDLLKQIHGNNRHIGNRPTSYQAAHPQWNLEQLRKELEEAIQKEEFEKAAEIRDMIRELEGKPGGEKEKNLTELT